MYVEPSPRRVRVVVNDRTVADSRSVKLVHEAGHQPVYYFPAQDVDAQYLRPSDRSTHCPRRAMRRTTRSRWTSG